MLLFGAVVGVVVGLRGPNTTTALYALAAADTVAVLIVLFVRVCCDAKSEADSEWGDVTLGTN